MGFTYSHSQCFCLPSQLHAGATRPGNTRVHSWPQSGGFPHSRSHCNQPWRRPSTRNRPPSSGSVSSPPPHPLLRLTLPNQCPPHANMTSSSRSRGASCITVSGLSRGPIGLQSLRMALHPPRPPLHSLCIRHLPRPHHPPSAISPPPAVFPLPHPLWSLRGQP